MGRTSGEAIDVENKGVSNWSLNCSPSNSVAKVQGPGEWRVVPAPEASALRATSTWLTRSIPLL